MATLKMNTDLAYQTASQFERCITALEAELNTSRSSVNTLTPEWIANASTQFEGEFQQWAEHVQGVIERLRDLKSRLEREITEWENTSSSFGG